MKHTLYKLSIYMECGDTFHSIISIWTWIWLHVHILSLLHALDINIDLFKIDTILFIIIKDSKYKIFEFCHLNLLAWFRSLNIALIN